MRFFLPNRKVSFNFVGITGKKDCYDPEEIIEQ